MKYKKTLLPILLVLIIFLGTNIVSAATLEIKVGNSIYEEENQTNKVYNKELGDKPAFCISGFNKTPQAGTCTKDNDLLSSSKRKVIGQIISSTCTNGCTGFGENYALSEISIFEYLQQFDSNIQSTGKPAIEETAQKIFQDAVKSVDSAKVTVSLSSSNLVFSIKNGYYVSNTIKVTNSSNLDDISFSSTGAQDIEIVKSSNSAYVKVPVKNVTQSTTITLKAKGEKNYPTVDLYNCGGTSQDVALLTTYSISDSSSVKGTITPMGSLTINKVDKNNQPVKGAKITVTGPNNYSVTYTTDGTSKVLNNLTFGTYTIKEIESPDGYILAQDKTVTLSSTALTQTVNLIDEYNKVTISKLDATGKQELPGATLEIQDKEGKIVKYCTDTNGNKNIECKWISTDKPYIIEGMPSGKYYLVETIAPDRYVLNKEKVEFEVKNNVVETRVIMENKLNKVKISKTSVATSKELPGATLEIQDKDGKVVNFCIDAKGEKDKACKWVSTDKPYEIEGMPNGKYYLVETLAPEGYVLSKEKIEFIVDGSEEIVKVEMKNNLEIKVPDTLSSRSVLLVAISMFDIALGIGILTYVKKNKVQE